MYALNTKKISSGFTTIEVIIATGWTSLLLLAAYSGFSSIMGQNQATKMMVGQNEFVSSISQEIALPSKCSNNLSTITLPAPGTKSNLTLNNYRGYGSRTDSAGNPVPISATTTTPYIVPGSNNSLRLTELSYERVTGSGSETIGGVPYDRHIFKAHIVTEILRQGAWEKRPERILEVPVLVDPGTNQISSCIGSKIADAPDVSCATLGGTISPKDGSCKVNQNDFRGFFATSIQVGSAPPTDLDTAPCRFPNPQGNPSINGGCNCPPSNIKPGVDTYRYQTGSGQWSYTYYYAVGCGKKGTCYYPATLNYVDTYFVCVDNEKYY